MSCSTVGSATFPGTFSATVRLRELGLEGANEKCYMFLPAVEFDDKTIVFGKIGPRGSDRPKQYFTVLPKLKRTSQSKFCFPNRNRTEPNM